MDHAAVHLSIVMVTDKILADFAPILSLLKGVKLSHPLCQNTFTHQPRNTKTFFLLSLCCTKTPFLNPLACQHTFLASPAMPKHFSGYSRHTKTLFWLAPECKNTCLGSTARPKHFWTAPLGPLHQNAILASPATP